MGAVDVNLWGSMNPNPEQAPCAFQEQHQGEGPGSYRETIERVKAKLDEYAVALEALHLPPAAVEGPAPVATEGAPA